MQRQVLVVAAVIERGGRFLLARRPPWGEHGGSWEFPGGKVEPGEEEPAALARELAEELGVGVQVGPKLAEARSGRVLLRAYRVELLGEPLVLAAGRLRWFRREELHSIELPPADRSLLAALG